MSMWGNLTLSELVHAAGLAVETDLERALLGQLERALEEINGLLAEADEMVSFEDEADHARRELRETVKAVDKAREALDEAREALSSI